MEERFIPVVFFRDPETGERKLRRVVGEQELRTPDPGPSYGTIQVRIARFPVGFVEDKGRRRAESDANRRFEIRKSRRGMSFVRAGRELQTVDAFPRSKHDIASGLGRWPLLQGYAYHWGIEVRFKPDLDDVFGITNDKQGVRPIEDFWRVLAEAEIDLALHRENRWQSEQRKKPPVPQPPETTSRAERSAQAADVATGIVLRIPDHRLPQAIERFESRAQERVGTMAGSLAEARAALELESKRRPYRLEYVPERHGPIYEPLWVGPQMVVRVNTDHPLYQVLYGDLLRMSGAARAKEAVDLILICLAKAELTAEDEEMGLWYATQRTQRWSPFLETAIKSLAQQFENTAEDQDVEESPEAQSVGSVA
jgi:hypothetical protein